eukprot:m.889534 g.889534  ORF g.889534 m.889534 type:complete len:84 (-) comp23645_c0_seq6:5656-5907(-)
MAGFAIVNGAMFDGAPHSIQTAIHRRTAQQQYACTTPEPSARTRQPPSPSTSAGPIIRHNGCRSLCTDVTGNSLDLSVTSTTD